MKPKSSSLIFTELELDESNIEIICDLLDKFHLEVSTTIYQQAFFIKSLFKSFEDAINILIISTSEINLKNPQTEKIQAIYLFKIIKKKPYLEISSAGVLIGYPGPSIRAEFTDVFLSALAEYFCKKSFFYRINLDGYRLSLEANRKTIKNSRVDSPYIDLKIWNGPVKEKFSKYLKYRLKERGERLRFEHLDVRDLDDDLISGYLNLHFDFHIKKWKDSVFKQYNSDYKKFFIELFINQKHNSNGSISIIRIDEEIAAMHFGFTEASKFYFFSPTINLAFEKFSPGQLLINQLLQHLKSTDLPHFDFMNDLEPYKLNWTETVSSRFFYKVYSHKFLTWNFQKYNIKVILKLLIKSRNSKDLLRNPLKTIMRYIKF